MLRDRKECVRSSRRAPEWFTFAVVTALAALLLSAPARAAGEIAALLSERGIAAEELADLRSWRLAWNPERGGTLSGFGRLSLPADPQRVVRQLATEQAELFGLSAAEITPTDTRRAGRIAHHFYQQTCAGLPVEGSQLCFSFTEAGDLLAFTARTAAHLNCPRLTPRISAEEAEARAQADLPPVGAILWREGDLAILPARFSGLPEDRLIWRLRCRTEAPLGGWRIFVDAHSGEILMRRSLIYGATEGRIVSEIYDPTPYSTPTTVGLPDLSIALHDGGEMIAADYTDVSGEFSFASGAAGLQLTATLAGLYAEIHEDSLAAPPPTLTGTIAGTPVELAWNTAAASPSAREAYVHVNRAHAWLKRMDPLFTALDQPIPVLVNDPEITCNAYAFTDPEAPSLAFAAAAGSTCAATARIADVVYHEYGHLATLFAYYPGYAPDDLHEGFSDYFAATLTDSSLIGRDLLGPGTFLRDVHHDMVYPGPPNCASNEYCRGLFIAGVLWNIRTALIATQADRAAAVAQADSLFHFARAGKPQTLDGCLHHVLLQDDDDGDLTNGTPNLALIAAAFEQHNIGDFEIYIDHMPLPDLEDTTATPTAGAYITAVFPLVAEGLRLHMSVDGGDYAIIPLQAVAASPSLYRATLPAQPADTHIRYYLSAEDESGRSALSPAGAPDTTWSYFVGADHIAPDIEHAASPGPVAGQERLWLAARVEDNSGEIDSVRVDLTIVSQGTERHSRGALSPKAPLLDNPLYEVQLDLGTLLPGDMIRYQFSAWDGAEGPNLGIYPADEPIVQEVRRGSYWDFSTDPVGLTLEGDWERGTPQTGPGAGHSGQTAAGVALSGTYQQNLESHLTLTDLDFSDWGASQLNFAIWYQTEPEWDGAWVEGSTNGGLSWETLIPIGGYPGEITFGGRDRRPGFTGESGDWQTYTIPLDPYVGEQALVRFVFRSDELVTDVGCFLDDMRVAEEQALIPVEQLAATSGDDGLVQLAWEAPPRINTASSAFLGYRLYRSTEPLDPGAEILTPLDHYAETWNDTDVVNGTPYYYAVSALYITGESARSPEVQGYPYRTALEVASEFSQTLNDSAASRDTLWIANAGTGELHVELYHADSAETWSELLPRVNASGAMVQPFQTIAEDAQDATAPDLEYVAYKVVNGQFTLRLGFYDPLPDPESEFTLEILLDVDLSRATGYPGPNAGADYIVMMGTGARELTGQIAYLLDGNHTPLAPTSNVIMQAGLDMLEVSIPVMDLGQPAEAGLAVIVEPRGDPVLPGDQIPDGPASSWLALETLLGTATPDAPLPVALAFDFSGYAAGDYTAKLILQTNDPDRPREEVAIAAHLSELLPTVLASWSASSLADGLELSWDLVDPEGYVAFYLRRWSGALTDEATAFEIETPILPVAEGAYRYLDRRIPSGVPHYYRLIGWRADGTRDELAPPLLVRYEPQMPLQLELGPVFPNPFRTETLLRIQAPEGGAWDLMVYDVTGRRVRTLMRPEDSAPGTHQILWNGCDDRNRRLGQGLFFARARCGAAEKTARIVLIR